MKNKWYISRLVLTGASALCSIAGYAAEGGFPVVRTAVEKRNFISPAVEKTIDKIQSSIGNKELAWMFGNCFPNTLDTTVSTGEKNGRPDTYVITGDIDAMWLRDSSAQVWPYLPLMKEDPELQKLIAGVVNRQTECVLRDPYANAFYKEADKKGEWQSDYTDMRGGIHERKWEIDSLCYTIRLAYHYWKTTGDPSVFNDDWKKAAALILKTFRTEQRKDGLGPYHFERSTPRQLDTLSNHGYGRPLKPVGLINSSFRPSDDATTYGFLVPANMFAIVSLRQLAEISDLVTKDADFAGQCRELAAEVDAAIKKYAIVSHPKYGKVYAFEVDGFGNATFMDDANIPSLIALPYLGCVAKDDPIYLNTRKLVWSEDNPYFFKGKAGEGIGGPHVNYDMIWPMSIILRALTATNDAEIKESLQQLRATHAGTGFMHETFHKNDPSNFTRPWFAWVNTLFGEMILDVYKNNPSLLN